MCGILGVSSSFATRDRVEAALAKLAWRGPDARKVELAGEWWLGVARLAISDPATGQPLRCERTGNVVAFNGVLTDAAREFRRFGGSARSRNDAELVLLRFAAAGESGLFLGPGHHAAALVAPELGTTWLLRDREGEKPLWAWRRGTRIVAFASSLAALRALGLDFALRDEEVARFLRYGWQPLPEATGSGDEVFEVPSGVHRIGASGAFERVEVPAVADAGPGSLRVRLERAVQRCAEAEVPVALALSGGIDSACIAAALAAAGRRVPAYQWRALGAPSDERELARTVATHTGLELREVDSGPEILAALPALTAAVGLPLGDPSLLATHALACAVARDGGRVLLGGEGGDELFLGYDRQRAAAWLPSLRWNAFAARLRGTSRVARLARALTAPDPAAELLAAIPVAVLRDILPDPGLAEVGLRAVPEATPETGLARARALDRHGYLRWDLLPKLDTALMAAGVEGRCPFLDPEVTGSPEALAAPTRAALGKRALREAFHSALPRAVFARRKTGFGIPLDRWLRTDAFVADLLSERRTQQRAHLRPGVAAHLLDLHRKGQARLGRVLHALVALEVWLRWNEAAT